MSKFKVGDRVIVERDLYESGEYYGAFDGVEGTIYRIRGEVVELQDVVGNGFTGSYYSLNIKGLKLKEKTMDNLQIGDTVVKNTGWGEESFTVEAKLGRIYVGVDEGDMAVLFTAKELEEQEFELPSDVLEVTVAEVSKKFGKTVKIVEE